MSNTQANPTDVMNRTSDISTAVKTYYDTELLENSRAELYYTQLGRKQPLPAGRGKSVEWRKWNTLPNASALTEGVVPTGERFGQSSITGTVNQYGMYVTVSDQLEMHALDDVILGACEELGASAGQTQDKLVRDTLMTGTNVIYCDNVDSDGDVVSTPEAPHEMRNVPGTAMAKLTPDMVNKAVTWLRKQKAPRIDGKYVAVIHPSVAYDLRSDPAWIDAHKYSAPTELFNGEIGELHGCRFLESTEAPVLVGADLGASTRYLVAGANAASDGTPGTALTDSGDEGETTKYYITCTAEAVSPVVGRTLIVAAAADVDDEADITIRGTVTIAGYDKSAKKLYLTAAAPTGTVSGDYLLPGEGAKEYKDGGANAAYATLFFGRGAFGVIDPEGGGMEMIIHPRGEAGGPLDQYSTVGYKFSTDTQILYPERMVRVMSVSSYGDTDLAN